MTELINSTAKSEYPQDRPPHASMSRRQFVAASAAGAMIVPRHVLGGTGHIAPSAKLNIAIIGAGGMGMSNAENLTAENIVAICDVDFPYVERQLESKQKDGEGKPREKGIALKDAFTKAVRYSDFRVMLEKQKDIDAVVIATPDHTHAVIADMAMKMGRHVYVQKPLTSTVHEARVLAQTARATGVVTQMGNQGHSMDDARIINEWIQGGAIGPVHEVHIWTNRPIWPQGIARPLDFAALQAANGSVNGSVTEPRTSWNSRAIAQATAAAMAADYRVPDSLDWDLYLGPADVPYHPIYHPFNWRGWVDFGVGALGDMAAHLLDHPYWALGLGYPTSVEATSTPFGGPRDSPATYPLAMTAHYEFPARGIQPPVRVTWRDGGLMPPRHPMLPDDLELNREGGVMYIGEWGVLMHETYGRNPRLFPEERLEHAKAIPQTYERIPDDHETNWVRACKGETKTTSPFEYAAPLTEVMLLGIVALRAGQGKKIVFDPVAMRVTNDEEANRYLTREYRAGWSV
ncbi:MAG TPA: Gfo/Idh/MocA family oxidoreductase [Longimicrobiales bacterium]|nr:Gfo/Idh/MocA family oxidoreductase [Longimicrobiales bacterium]